MNEWMNHILMCVCVCVCANVIEGTATTLELVNELMVNIIVD